ncbi:unnamed protein product, partial [Nesidiocoris tenuis]
MERGRYERSGEVEKDGLAAQCIFVGCTRMVTIDYCASSSVFFEVFVSQSECPTLLSRSKQLVVHRRWNAVPAMMDHEAEWAQFVLPCHQEVMNRRSNFAREIDQAHKTQDRIYLTIRTNDSSTSLAINIKATFAETRRIGPLTLYRGYLVMRVGFFLYNPSFKRQGLVSCCGNILWFEKCNTSEYAAGGHRPTRSDAAKHYAIRKSQSKVLLFGILQCFRQLQVIFHTVWRRRVKILILSPPIGDHWRGSNSR